MFFRLICILDQNLLMNCQTTKKFNNYLLEEFLLYLRNLEED